MSTTEETAEPECLSLVDCRCTRPRCDEPAAYRMRGHCTNCGNDALLGLFSAGHEVGQGVLGWAKCPTCGNHTCRWDRLATADETPGEATP
jgi:ribosomal protein S27E